MSIELLVQLRRSRAFMRQRVGGVRELIHKPCARRFSRDPLRHVLVIVGMPRADIGTRKPNIDTECAKVRDLLRRHLVRDDEDQRIALRGRHQRQPKPGIPGRCLDDRTARFEFTGFLGRLDHRHGHPIFDRSTRVLIFEL